MGFRRDYAGPSPTPRVPDSRLTEGCARVRAAARQPRRALRGAPRARADALRAKPVLEALERVGSAELREFVDQPCDLAGREPGKDEARVALHVRARFEVIYAHGVLAIAPHFGNAEPSVEGQRSDRWARDVDLDDELGCRVDRDVDPFLAAHNGLGR